MEAHPYTEQVFFLKSSDDHQFGVVGFMPADKHPEGMVLIIPGMAEHSGRYREYMTFLAENNMGCFCLDHPGSGITAGGVDKTGFMPSTRGWEIMLGNIRALYTHIRKQHPNISLYIMGHSMGSILARHFMAVYPVYIQGLILSGTFESPRYLLWLVRPFIKLQVMLFGSARKSKWFNKMFYHNFNRHFDPRPTQFEWISSVREEADSYNEDPYCGFECSWGFYKTLFLGISVTRKAQHNLKYRKTLPVLLLSGQEDPVGNFGKDAIRVYREFYRQRFRNITVKVFRGRHEMLHEENKEQVFFYLLNWMQENRYIR